VLFVKKNKADGGNAVAGDNGSSGWIDVANGGSDGAGTP
jgi:hypothetical protein